MNFSEQKTGVLRGDIRLLHGESLMLFDPAADSYYKVTSRFADIISYFSEELSYTEMLEKLRYNGIETTVEELHKICEFLRINSLLVPRYGEISARQSQLEKLKKKTLLVRISAAYLFYRFPPIHPEHFFKAIAPYVSFLAGPLFLLLLSIPAVFGYILALRDFGRVVEQFTDTISWMGLVKYLFAIIAVKIIHEIAHSLAAIRFNCRVRGIGVGLIFFVPRLYTDTTDSWRLPRRKRLLIDGAGIIAEVIIGGIAALFWNFLPPGIWKSTMFYLFAISTLSTLLVNGNIFIRYDGYYIFSDLLGIENLMKRSSDCVKQTWRWYFLRLGAPSREKRLGLLICYGISAFIYRIFLYTSICLLIYYSFTKTVAILMLFLELYSLLFYPLAQEVKTIWNLSRKSAGIALWFFLYLIIAVVGCILFIPLSWGIALPGETVPEKRLFVTVEESGYLRHSLPAQERTVRRGEVIAELDSPQLNFSIEKIRKTIAFDKELFQQQQLDEKEFHQNEVTAQKIKSDKLALDELLRREQNLSIKAENDGIFIPMLSDYSAGVLLKKNLILGEIVSRKNIVYAYASDDQVGKIYIGQKGHVILPDSLKKFPCSVIRIEPVSVTFKPSPLLQLFGGSIAAYKKGENEFMPAQTLYRIELEIPGNAVVGNGRVVKVKLLYTEQLYPNLKKILLSFFRKEF